MKGKGFWLPLVIWGGVLLISVLLYSRMPDQIPTHWNWRGEIDGWGDKQWAAWMMPAIMLGLLLLFQALPWLSPRQFEIQTFRKTYDFIIVLLMLMFGSLHVVFLLPAVGIHPPIDSAVMVILSAFFMLLGTVLDKVQRNFFVGVRTPWTIASERVWTDTHRVAARLFFWSGLLGIAAAVVLPLCGGKAFLSLPIILAGALISVPYSLFRYKQLERRGELDTPRAGESGDRSETPAATR
jgi:uncharacterized membrane protein